jgi:hypothetical protein
VSCHDIHDESLAVLCRILMRRDAVDALVVYRGMDPGAARRLVACFSIREMPFFGQTPGETPGASSAGRMPALRR